MWISTREEGAKSTFIGMEIAKAIDPDFVGLITAPSNMAIKSTILKFHMGQ